MSRSTTFTASAGFWDAAGVQPACIVADLDWIRRKHPKDFKSLEAVADHIRFVLSGDRLVRAPGSSRNAWVFVRPDSARCAVVQIELQKQTDGTKAYRVLTAYTLKAPQLKRLLDSSNAPGGNPGSSGNAPKGCKPGSQGQPSGVASRCDEEDTPAKKRSNPGLTFGSKEWNAHYGLGKGHTHGSGAHAKKRQAAKGRGAAALTKKGADKLAQALEGDSKFMAGMREHQAEGKALGRILGPSGRAHAVKIAKEHGTFSAADVRALLGLGWSVLPASTVPAKLGATLGPMAPWEAALNPSEPVSGQVLARILGPKGEARAVVLGLSTAAIGADMVQQLRESGYDVSAAPKAAREGRVKLNPSGTERHESESGRQNWGQSLPMALNPKKPTRKAAKAQAKPAPKAKAPKKAASKATAKAKAPAPVQPLRSRAADAHRLVKAVEKALTPKTSAAKAKRKGPTLKVEKVTVTAKAVNPSATALGKAWETWTGSKPGQALRVKVKASTVETPAGTAHLPSDVVFLGRVSKLITKAGTVKDFADSGPYLVTDAAMRHLWLVSQKVHRFDLKRLSVIGYLAKKPKFGDRDRVEYVHAFESTTRAAMEGQLGLITGGFRITPRGIEG